MVVTLSMEWVFDEGKLVRGKHDGIAQNLYKIADETGVPPGYIAGTEQVLGRPEELFLDTFKDPRRRYKLGLVYAGDVTPSPINLMRSVAGVLTRNFVECKMMSRDTLMRRLFDRADPPMEEFVAIPDFHVEGLSRSIVNSLESWLIGRGLSGRMRTALWIRDKGRFNDAFPTFSDYVKENYILRYA